MLDLNITIEVKEKNDLDTVIEAIKSLGIEKPVYILNYGDHFNVRYDTNEFIERIDGVLADLFPNYAMVENIGVGQTTIKIIISIMQTPASTDNWGRPFNSDAITKTYYFIEEKTYAAIALPEDNLRVLFGSEEKRFQIYITPVVHKVDADKKGFIVTKTPFKTTGPQDLMSDRLFASPKTAVWEGYRKMEQMIEEEYEKFMTAYKKKRRRRNY